MDLGTGKSICVCMYRVCRYHDMSCIMSRQDNIKMSYSHDSLRIMQAEGKLVLKQVDAWLFHNRILRRLFSASA